MPTLDELKNKHISASELNTENDVEILQSAEYWNRISDEAASLRKKFVGLSEDTSYILIVLSDLHVELNITRAVLEQEIANLKFKS